MIGHVTATAGYIVVDGRHVLALLSHRTAMFVTGRGNLCWIDVLDD
jgi:hypothetical protein